MEVAIENKIMENTEPIQEKKHLTIEEALKQHYISIEFYDMIMNAGTKQSAKSNNEFTSIKE